MPLTAREHLTTEPRVLGIVRASLVRTRLLSVGALALAVTACVTLRNLDDNLNQAVGQRPSEVRYPPLDRVVHTHAAGSTEVVEYALSGTGNCRWVFEIAKESGRIVAWRYSDEIAASYCRGLATTRP
jgi:hypothetical protein